MIPRYLLPLDGTSFSPGGNTFFLHWDDDEGTSRSVVVELWSLFEVSGEEYTILARFEAVSVCVMHCSLDCILIPDMTS